MTPEVDIIASVRSIRKIIMTLDSLGLPIYEISNDEEINSFIPKNLPEDIIAITAKIHIMLQNIEKSKKYRDIIKNYCNGEQDD